jgi:hypothetical protein
MIAVDCDRRVVLPAVAVTVRVRREYDPAVTVP